MTLHISNPEPGFYRFRRVKGGCWTPVKIFRPCACSIGGFEDHDWVPECDRFYPLRALIDGYEETEDILPFWNWLHPISEAEYEFLCADHAWARSHAPHLPEANPRVAVRLGDLPPVLPN